MPLTSVRNSTKQPKKKVGIHKRASTETTTINEERLHLVMGAGNIGFWDWDIVNDQINWSDEIYKIHGIHKSNFKGSFKDFKKLIHPEDSERVIQAIEQAVKKGTSFRDEFRVVHPDGVVKWVSTNTKVISNQNNKAIRMFGVSFDITEKKESENTLRFLAEASKVLASSLDYESTLQNVAALAVPEFADWCSIDIKTERGVEQLAIAHADHNKVRWAKKLRIKNQLDTEAKTGVAAVLRTGMPEFHPHISQELLARSVKDKSQLQLLKKLSLSSVMILPITVENETLGAISFVSAESARHYNTSDLLLAKEVANRASLAIQNARLYQAAQENERKFESFFHSNIVGVFIADSHGDIIDANDGFLKMIGYEKDAVEKRKLNRWKLTPPEYREKVLASIQELKEQGKTKQWEKEFIKKDGSQVPVIVAATLVNKNGDTNINIVLDITERKRLEQRKDEFIGIASHELKTPLTSIKGYIQILERIIEEMGDDKTKRIIARTNTYINRLNSLIADLLDVSKIQSGKLQFNMTTFNSGELVKDAIESMEPIVSSHKIILKDSINQEVEGDRHRLEQVLVNLLSNAIKYSPEADEIIISMKREKHEVVVSVTDFGVGIADKNHSKLFQRFYRVESTAREFSGLGIGLYISGEIINRHHGKIWVESEEGYGATFYFSLPIKQMYEK